MFTNKVCCLLTNLPKFIQFKVFYSNGTLSFYEIQSILDKLFTVLLYRLYLLRVFGANFFDISTERITYNIRNELTN